MKEYAKLVGVLGVICLLSGILLAEVHRLTKDAIAHAERAEKLDALKMILPSYDNDPDSQRHTIVKEGAEWIFYVATKDGRTSGIAFEGVSQQGYGGQIRLIGGVSTSGTLQKIRILEHTETPGLGAKIAEPDFMQKFEDKSADDIGWCILKKDDQENGRVDAITGATISSRAVTDTVRKGLSMLATHKEEILGNAASRTKAGAQ